MLRTLSIFCCVLMLGLTLTPDVAEAKRFGGGGSFGKSFFTPKKAAPKPAPKAAPQQAASKTATATKKPAMGGMLGGLLAGGLLGALFFGGAFEGIQIMDVLIMAVIAFVLFKLFAGRKPMSQPGYAGHSAPPHAEPVAEQGRPEPQAFTGGGFSWGGAAADAPVEVPAWFDQAGFLEGAKGHFVALQQAWNRNDLELIRSYCAPALYRQLEQVRAELGDGLLDNDPVSVFAELVGYGEEQQQAQVSVLFSGWVREGSDSETSEFRELWHLTRDLSADNADWFIEGIQQLD